MILTQSSAQTWPFSVITSHLHYLRITSSLYCCRRPVPTVGLFAVLRPVVLQRLRRHATLGGRHIRRQHVVVVIVVAALVVARVAPSSFDEEFSRIVDEGRPFQDVLWYGTNSVFLRRRFQDFCLEANIFLVGSSNLTRTSNSNFANNRNSERRVLFCTPTKISL